MAFVARTRAQIRDALLSYWSARYLASQGAPLLTSAGSDAYMEAESVALVLETYEQRGLTATAEIFPDTASNDGVTHHGYIDNVARKQATSAIVVLQIVGGTIGGTVTFGAATVSTAAGVKYIPSANADGTGASITLDGSGNGTFYGTCQTAGTVGNAAIGTVLTWSATPANASVTVTVASNQVTAVDIETFAAWAARIIARRREHPSGGNRSDWRSWLESVSNVAEGYIYPLFHSTLGANTLGAVTAIPLGYAPSPPSTGTTSRLLLNGDVANIKGYIEGTNDATGVATASGTQLRPTVIVQGDYSIELPSTFTQNVLVTGITFGSGFSFPWSGTLTTAGGSSGVTIQTSSSPITAGVVAGQSIAIPNSNVRGGYEIHTVASTTASTIVLTTAMLNNPAGGLTIYPAPTNWPQMRDAVLGIFDRLGPGDTSPASRYPAATEVGPFTLYPSAIAAAVMGVPGLSGAPAGVSGVLGATCTTPGAAVVATQKQLIVPGTIIFTV